MKVSREHSFATRAGVNGVLLTLVLAMAGFGVASCASSTPTTVSSSGMVADLIREVLIGGWYGPATFSTSPQHEAYFNFGVKGDGSISGELLVCRDDNSGADIYDVGGSTDGSNMVVSVLFASTENNATILHGNYPNPQLTLAGDWPGGYDANGYPAPDQTVSITLKRGTIEDFFKQCSSSLLLMN